MRTRARIVTAAAATAALIVGGAGLALADNVQNDVIAGGNDTTTAGVSTTINYKIAQNNGDGQTGCNASDSTPATVTINAPSGVTASPGSLTFTSCGTNKPVTFSSSVPGNYSISVSVSDLGTGTYNTSPASFTLAVNPAAPTNTPPTLVLPSGITAEATGPAGAAVSYTATANDTEDGSLTPTCTPASGSPFPLGLTTVNCSVTDNAGESASGSFTVTVRDTTAPTGITFVGGPAAGGTYYFGSVPAAPTCTATDTVDTAVDCNVSGYSTAVGTHALTATATDDSGNSATGTSSYTVAAWTLKGFYSPVDMSGVWNTVKGGSTVPLKFEAFAGTELTTTSAIKSFTQKTVACPNASAAVDEIEIVSTGGTSLRYDATAGQFIQNWATPKKPGTCYTVTMTTQDGSALSANFLLK